MELSKLKEKGLRGEPVSREEADWLASYPDLNALCDAAEEISVKWTGREIDSCSIVNARSGMCGEDCKWCAQATRHHTGCATYNFLDEEEVMAAARENERNGVKRFSLVTSGRAVGKKDLREFCRVYRRLADETGLYLCASMGLLGEEEMQMLRDADVKRYHCNMETSEKVFGTLCTTHLPADKKRTIEAARKCGMEICSGGIIGMGETMADRLDFAFELAALDVDSVPVNILNPIPGTPLENIPLISEEEVVRTCALFRFILPKKSLRFAGGRKRMSHASMARMLSGGMNGAMIGDLLTSVGNSVEEDRRLFSEAGKDFGPSGSVPSGAKQETDIEKNV